MKRFRFSLLVLMLLIGSSAMWAHDFEVDGIYYNITSSENKTVEVTFRGEYYDSYSHEYTGAVTIPETITYGEVLYNVTSIGSYAFGYCRGLTSITLPDGVTSIGSYAFGYCRGLTSITLPDGVTFIGSYAFVDCYGLTSIAIPESVTSIGEYAFINCYGLTSIVVEEGNGHYNSRNNCNAIIETETNTLIAGCENTIIPNGVTSIGF